MHGPMDAMHMFELHTKLVHKKEITWTELENMIPFEKEAYISILLKTLEEDIKKSTAHLNNQDINPDWGNN